MSKSKQQVWQIACGEAGRRYDNLFKNHDIMLLGPGEYGSFSNGAYDNDQVRRYYTGNSIGQVKSFANFVQPNDLVLLLAGHRVISMGMVAPDQSYKYFENFDDIHGWNLCHSHRVAWQTQLEAEIAALQNNGDLFQDRRSIPSITKVTDQRILDPIQHLFARCVSRDLRDLPNDLPPPMSLEKFGESLFAKGLSYD